MLKINPVITTNNSKNQGLHVCKPDFFVSDIPTKTKLTTDIFQKQQVNEIKQEGIFEQFKNFSFTGSGNKNRYKLGEEIATNIQKILDKKIGALSSKSFETEYDKITEKNIVPTIKAYNVISPKESLIAAICKERANTFDTRRTVVKGITDKLVEVGDKLGVQTAHYKKHFDNELDKQFYSLLPVRAPQLDKISGALVQAIENKKSISKDEKDLLKAAKPSDTQSYTTSILTNSVKKARESMQAQASYDGWSCKFGEQIRKIWKSDNQKQLVHDDINIFENQITELNKLVGKKEYNDKFKEIFDVDYDPELIASYKQKEEKFTVASVLVGVETNFKNAVGDLLKDYPLSDEYVITTTTGSIPYIKETKQEKYQRNFDAFAEFVGKGNIEKGRKEIKSTMKDYRINEKSSLEERSEILQKMAKKYAKRLHKNAENALGKQSLQELKREYESSYYAAFGVKNDIAKRVEDYRASQMLSELLLQDTILCAASIPFWMCTAGSGVFPTLKIAMLHSTADLLIYGSDRLSSKQGMTTKDVKEIIKWTAVDGATAFANQLTYKGIEALTSPIAKMSGTASKITDFALCTAADVGIDCGFEYLASGKVTFQGVVYSIIFSAGGYIIDMKVDEMQRKKF